MAPPDPLLVGTPASTIVNHPRHPFVAGGLALVCPGLGHFYCGATRAGLIWSIAPYLALLGMMLLGALDASKLHLWLAAGVVLCVLLRLVQVVLAWRQAQRLGRYALQSTNTFGLYLAFFLVTSILTTWVMWPLRSYVVEPFEVVSASMEPSLSVGDEFFVVKVGPHSTIRRGDVVVFRRPTSAPFVARVMAVAGDRVEVRDNTFFINDVEQPLVPCTPPYVTVDDHGPMSLACFIEGPHRVVHFPGEGRYPELDPFTVPVGHLFVVGDNRDNSIDSREFGPISAEDVIGRVAVVWISFGSGLSLRTERIGLQP